MPGMELTVVPAGRGIRIQPKLKKGKHRLEDLIGFLNYKAPPISDEALFAPVDYEASGDWGNRRNAIDDRHRHQYPGANRCE